MDPINERRIQEVFFSGLCYAWTVVIWVSGTALYHTDFITVSTVLFLGIWLLAGGILAGEHA